MSCNQTSTYTPIFTQGSDNKVLTTIIILSILLPIQIICLVLYYRIYIRKSKKHRELEQKKETKKIYQYDEQQSMQRSQNNLRQNRQRQKDIAIQVYKQSKQKKDDESGCQKLCPKVGKRKQQIYFLVISGLVGFLVLLLFSIVVLFFYLVNITNTFQIILTNSECKLAQVTSQFLNGTNEWIGLSNYPSNITFLDLSIKTRVQASKNSIKSLLLNGTGASFPIGFPNNTAISITNSETDSSQNTVTTSTNVESYIQATLRQWLYRNSSLSNPGFKFPLCQNSTIATLPHPLPIYNDLGETVMLNYMSDICSSLTQQVDLIVTNGHLTDQLLTHLTSVQNNASDIETTLDEINQTTNTYALRSTQYETQFSVLENRYSTQYALGLTAFVMNILILSAVVILIIVFSVSVFKQRKLRKRVRQYDLINMAKNFKNFHKRKNHINRQVGKFRSGRIMNSYLPEMDKKRQDQVQKVYVHEDINNEYRYKQRRQFEEDQLNEDYDDSQFEKQFQDMLQLSSDSDEEQQDLKQARMKKILNRLQRMQLKQAILLPKKSRFFKVIIILFISNTLIGLLQITNGIETQKISEVCQYFQSSIQSEQSFLNKDNFLTFIDNTIISDELIDLLVPIQKCTSTIANLDSQQPDYPLKKSHFLSSSSAKTVQQLQVVQQIYKISSIYNSTVPTSVFDSQSIAQITVLQNYLINMETIPIQANEQFNITDVLSELNSYANGSSNSGNSPQVTQCGTIVLQDQFVYNVDDCQYPLIDYENQATITDPRCLQIPTYDGSSGTANSDLNNAQHTIILNSSCTTVTQFYDSSLPNCFLAKRIQVLIDAGCTNVANEYASRVEALLAFSLPAGSYTNSYLQNLRNFFGFYAVVNTNLSDFFANTNTSTIIDPIGINSNNIINRTLCQWVYEKSISVYNTFCSLEETENFVAHYFDIYVWIWIIWFSNLAIFAISICLEVGLRQYAVCEQINQTKRKFFKKKNKIRFKRMIGYENKKQISEGRARIEYKQSAKKLNRFQQSEQTFRNQNQYPVQRMVQKIDDGQFCEQIYPNRNIFDQKQPQVIKQSPKQLIRQVKRLQKTEQLKLRNINSQENKQQGLNKQFINNQALNDEQMGEDQVIITKEDQVLKDIQQRIDTVEEQFTDLQIERHNKAGRTQSAKQYAQKIKSNIISIPKHNNKKDKQSKFFTTKTEGLIHQKKYNTNTNFDSDQSAKNQQIKESTTNKLSKYQKESHRLNIVNLSQIIDKSIETVEMQQNKRKFYNQDQQE